MPRRNRQRSNTLRPGTVNHQLFFSQDDLPPIQDDEKSYSTLETITTTATPGTIISSATEAMIIEPDYSDHQQQQKESDMDYSSSSSSIGSSTDYHNGSSSSIASNRDSIWSRLEAQKKRQAEIRQHLNRTRQSLKEHEESLVLSPRTTKMVIDVQIQIPVIIENDE